MNPPVTKKLLLDRPYTTSSNTTRTDPWSLISVNGVSSNWSRVADGRTVSTANVNAVDGKLPNWFGAADKSFRAPSGMSTSRFVVLASLGRMRKVKVMSDTAVNTDRDPPVTETCNPRKDSTGSDKTAVNKIG